jgi:hypothetical protein
MELIRRIIGKRQADLLTVVDKPLEEQAIEHMVQFFQFCGRFCAHANRLLFKILAPTGKPSN